jgi:putative nucleotidyltransferase with HDIG domain
MRAGGALHVIGRKMSGAGPAVCYRPAPLWPVPPAAALLGSLLAAAAGRSRWWLASPTARALSSRGGRHGERGKATGPNAVVGDPDDAKPESLAALVFGPRGSKPQEPRRRSVDGGLRQDALFPVSGNHGATRRGQQAGGASEPTHLQKLWERARQRAQVNSSMKMDWLSAKPERRKDSTRRVLAGAKAAIVPRRRRGAGIVGVEDQPETAGHKSSLGPDGAEQARKSEPAHARERTVLEPLTKDFWDDLLLQRDPTKGLRDVALRSLLYEEIKPGSGPTPVDPTLWWLEKMIRIKWGGLSYLPKNLRRGEEVDMDIPQREKGEKVLINHVIQVTAQAPCRLRVRWAALLHDVGKPDTVSNEEGKLTFTNHEREGAKMVHAILHPYGYSDKFCKEVATLVLRSGRVRSVERFNDQGARRLLATMGPLFDDLVDLYGADCTSAKAHRQAEHQARADLLSQHVQAVLDRDRMASLRSPLNGHDIMRITGLKPGFKLGRLVRALRQDYLRRGPYSESEAREVVEQLHAQLVSGDPSQREMVERDHQPDLGERGWGGGWRPRRKRRAAIDTAARRSTGWRPLHAAEDAAVADEQREQVLVFRLRLDCHRWRVASESGGDKAVAAVGGVEVFRDVAVRRDTSLYTLAKVVSHAFDFDFDDDFAFYRRRRGLECPGAEAAYSGMPADVRPIVSGQQRRTVSCTSDVATTPALAQDPHSLNEEALAGQDFELLARTCGSSLRRVNAEGFAYRYDTLNEPQASLAGGDSVVEWQPDRGDDDELDGVSGVESLRSVGVESLSYPLRLPQLGPASLIHSLVGNLFDRSRRR